MKIGNVNLKNNLVLAPMAGYTDLAFRKLCKEYDCGLVVTEMISDKAILYDNNKTLNMLKIDELERPVCIQLFGDSAKSLKEAAVKVCKLAKPDMLNINMGCPVPKIAIRSKAGSSLMKYPELVGEIIKEVSSAVDVPLTVKIRTGWDLNSINCVKIAQIAELNGAKAIFIHGRTRSQGYSGKADWTLIKEVKEAVNIPVIGNGDIETYQDAKEKLEYSKVDALMIGRGCLGKPYIFKEINDYLNYNKIPDNKTGKEIIDIALKHIEYALEEKDERQVVLEMRSILGFYLKGIKNSKEIKVEINKINDIYDIINLLKTFKETL